MKIKNTVENKTNEELAQMIEELAAKQYYASDDSYLREAARRLRAKNPGESIREIYEAKNHLDPPLSDPAWYGDSLIDGLCFEFWAAIKAEVEGARDD